MSQESGSDAEKEYEVEYIQSAQVQGHGKFKRFMYEVKWKTYGTEENTMEPLESFQGSEHFVETFWERVDEARDWHRLSLFQPEEIIMPVGPPGRRRKGKGPRPTSAAKPKSAAKPAVVQDSGDDEPVMSTRSRSAAKPVSHNQHKSTPRAVRKRKISEVEVPMPPAGNGNSESEVQSIIAETPSAARARPRRRIETAEETASAPTRRGRKPNKQKALEDAEYVAEVDGPDDEDNTVETDQDDDEDEDEEEKPSIRPIRKSTRERRPSQAALAQERPRRASHSRKLQASSSTARLALSTPKRKRGRPRKVTASPRNKPHSAHRAESDEEADAQGETDLDAEADAEAEAMQVDTGAEADVEDEALMEIEHAPGLEVHASIEVPSSDVQEQDQISFTSETQVEVEDDALAREQSPEIPVLPVTQAEPEPELESTPPSPPSSKVPAHRARAAHPRVKLIDDTLQDDGPTGISTKARIKRRMSQHDEAGPSTVATAKAKATNGSPPKRVKPGPGRSSSGFQLGSTSLFTVVKKGAVGALRKVGVMSAANRPTENTDEEVTATDAPVVLTTTSKRAVELDGEAAASLPAREAPEVSPTVPGATSEEHIEVGPQAEPSEVLPPVQLAESIAPLVVPSIDAVEPLPATIAPSETLLSPSGVVAFKPDEAIGSGGSNGDPAAWKQTTIFGPLGVGSTGLLSPSLESPDSPAFHHRITIRLSTEDHLPVILKDIQGPSDSGHKPLNETLNKLNLGPAGRFYPAAAAETLVTAAFRTWGSHARVLLDPESDENQQRLFEQFVTRLTEGLCVASMSGRTLVFYAPENVALASKLGIPAKLVNSQSNIVVSEVEVKDDNAYMDALDQGQPW